MRILWLRYRERLGSKRLELTRNETVGHLARDCRGARELSAARHLKPCRRYCSHADDFGNDLIEALTLDELHRVEVNSVLLADVEHGHDVGVVQAGRHASLALESFEEYRVAGQVCGQDLECDVPAQRLLNGFVDDSHSTAAHFAENAVLS